MLRMVGFDEIRKCLRNLDLFFSFSILNIMNNTPSQTNLSTLDYTNTNSLLTNTMPDQSQTLLDPDSTKSNRQDQMSYHLANQNPNRILQMQNSLDQTTQLFSTTSNNNLVGTKNDTTTNSSTITNNTNNSKINNTSGNGSSAGSSGISPNNLPENQSQNQNGAQAGGEAKVLAN